MTRISKGKTKLALNTGRWTEHHKNAPSELLFY